MPQSVSDLSGRYKKLLYNAGISKFSADVDLGFVCCAVLLLSLSFRFSAFSVDGPGLPLPPVDGQVYTSGSRQRRVLGRHSSHRPASFG